MHLTKQLLALKIKNKKAQKLWSWFLTKAD